MRVEPGQRWTFVGSDGNRTEYVVVDPRDETQMDDATRRHLAPGMGAQWEDHSRPHSIVYLLNEKTGKYAMVTSFWLLGLSSADGRSHWVRPASEVA